MKKCERLSTIWGENIDSVNVLPEYPRPQMRRNNYTNLNGYWKYAITQEKKFPKTYDGEILVPFSPESALSGVNRQVWPDDYLHYSREVEIDSIGEGKRKLIHFGAVDQICAVYINGKRAGNHVGGYLPFSIDITKYIREGSNLLQVVVKDYSDISYHSRGKQKLDRGGMFYQVQSGIWQTVWMECVPEQYIERVKVKPNYDAGSVQVRIMTNEANVAPAEIIIREGEKEILRKEILTNRNEEIEMQNFKSWSPEDPFLYDMEICYGSDQVYTYFGMRKYETKKDKRGIFRFFLNNKPYFHNGLLDQGYWPEGLYTAPTDAALVYDIKKTKEMGYNMLRKHAKVEPARWYYHCDRLGVLVWQDMVNGGQKYNMRRICIAPNALGRAGRSMKDNKYGALARSDARGRRQYYHELDEMLRALYHFPSIAVWVPFNEGWGQFDANKVTTFIRERDKTRLVDQASGWFDQGGGDIYSVHNYWSKLKVTPRDRAIALSEFGGYSYRVEGHSYCDKVYGYRKYSSKDTLTKGYEKLFKSQIIPAVKDGLAATVYTQVSDVEEEVNGILTFDRKEIKMNIKKVKELNKLLYQEFQNQVK